MISRIEVTRSADIDEAYLWIYERNPDSAGL